MDPRRNPYTPNAGARPLAIVGRSDQLETFELLLYRLAAGRTEQSMIVTGLRGAGKTVLLGRFREVALEQDWVAIDQEVAKHSDEDFRRLMAAWMRAALFELSPRAKWSDRFTHAAGVLKSFSLSVDATGTLSAGLEADPHLGLADTGDLNHDLVDLFIAVGEAAQSARRGVVLLLDEIQFLNSLQLEALIVALHKTVQRGLPVTMVGAGLPQIAELTGDAKSYAEHLFKFPKIGSLDSSDASVALAEPARLENAAFTSDALRLAGEITGGYPYFIQELGYAVWITAGSDLVDAEDISRAIDVYEAKLDSSFFRVRLDRTTELQRAYLRAMAGLGSEPQKAADVAHAMGRTSSQIAPTRAELISMGLLYTPDHGYAAFTVPHFEKFMMRAVPELEVPPIQKRRRKTKEAAAG